MRVGCSTFVEAINDFILNTHAFTKLRRPLNNRMNVKTSSNYKEFSHGQKKMHEQYIQQLLITISSNPFHGSARNLMSSLNISFKIIDDLLAAKGTGEELHLEFAINRVTSCNTSFFETTKKSGITYKEERKKTPMAVSVLKKDRQALGFFASNFTDKKEVHYALTLYTQVIADPSGKFYQPTAKHLFRNELLKLSCDMTEKNSPQNADHICD